MLEQRLETLEQFVELLFETLDIAKDCKMMIFPINVREDFSRAIEDKYSGGAEKDRILETLRSGGHVDNAYTSDYGTKNEDSALELAGLTGAALQYKLAEISDSALNFYQNAGIHGFGKLLKKSLILLKSLVGAIPAIGSALQELIDFIEERVKDLTAKK